MRFVSLNGVDESIAKIAGEEGLRLDCARFKPTRLQYGMAAKPSPTPHEVADALRSLADELDKLKAPLPPDVTSKLMPLVSATRAAPNRLLEVLAAASKFVRAADIAELAGALEVASSEAALIRDENAAARSERRASG